MSAEWRFLITLNEHLRPLKDPVAIQDVAVRLIGEHLHTNHIRILGVSMLARNETADAIEHAGAAGFFVKGTDTQRLIDYLLAFHASHGAGERAGS